MLLFYGYKRNKQLPKNTRLPQQTEAPELSSNKCSKDSLGRPKRSYYELNYDYPSQAKQIQPTVYGPLSL